MSYKIADATTPGAIKIQFSCRQNHSEKQLEQHWHVRTHGYIICPGTGDKIEEFNQQMAQQPPSAVWRAFAEMPIGAVGIVPSSEGMKKGSHALVVRFTGSVIAGPAPGLRCAYNEDGDFSIIAPSHSTVAPLEHPFNCIYRHVEVIGELTDEEVRAWAAAQAAPADKPTFYTRNPWVCHVAGSKSWDTTRKLWLSSPIEVVQEEAHAESVSHITQAERVLCEREMRLFGSVKAGGLLERAQALLAAEQQLASMLSI